MSARSRWLVAVASVLLIGVYWLPLWSIRLVAPQYPEGLGMHIHVQAIRGHQEHDLQNINILNHYIGMQPIDPAEVPELDIMPIAVAAVIALGLLAAVSGSVVALVVWIAVFGILGLVGLADFYLWLYDYGHNLSPDAPIKVPGMSYQPPLIGTTRLLNITASSWPHLGSLLLFVSAAAGLYVVVREGWPRVRGSTP